MVFEISDNVLQQTGISSNELLLKIAIMLFQEETLTLAQAAKLAGLHQIGFQMVLSERNIPIHYGEEQYNNDLKNIAFI